MNVLLIVYKIEKGKGSEDGTGYHLTSRISQKIDKTTIISRQKNIDKLKGDPAFINTDFIAVDLPWILCFYKRGGRGIILYYYIWQLFCGFRIHHLQKIQSFDVIHQVNFHATWAPHFIFSNTAKIITGPLTHHPSIPLDCWFEGYLAFAKELIRRVVKKYFFYVDPFLKWSLARTDHIFLGHDDYVGVYSKHRQKISLLPQAGTTFQIKREPKHTKLFKILFIGRFVSLKGCIFAMQAARDAILSLDQPNQKNIEITFIGEGSLYGALSYLASQIEDDTGAKASVVKWMNQDELSQHYKESTVFLFPSFEGQGLVVAEALAHGCPVICLEDTGPHSICQNTCITIPKGERGKMVEALKNRIITLIDLFFNDNSAYQRLATLAFDRADDLTWDHKVSVILDRYND